TGVKNGRPEVRKDSRFYTVKGEDFQIGFDRKNGALTSYVFRGEEQLFRPLMPHFTRPLTDNDRKGWKPHEVLKPWYEARPQLKKMHMEEQDGAVTVRSTYTVIKKKAE